MPNITFYKWDYNWMIEPLCFLNYWCCFVIITNIYIVYCVYQYWPKYFLPLLLIKVIDLYFPLFYHCLMTSAGGIVTYLSRGENKLNYHPLNLNILADFSLENCGFLTIAYLVFQKTIKLCATTFWGNFTSTRVPLTKLACKNFPAKLL